MPSHSAVVWSCRGRHGLVGGLCATSLSAVVGVVGVDAVVAVVVVFLVKGPGW